MQQQKSQNEIEEQKLERALNLIQQLEPQIDIFTLNKAIAIILERRARSKTVWQEWLSKKFQDVEGSASTGPMHPLVPDLK
jgi:DNA-directed RNA polymerase specialized sigma54-like protein